MHAKKILANIFVAAGRTHFHSLEKLPNFQDLQINGSSNSGDTARIPPMPKVSLRLVAWIGKSNFASIWISIRNVTDAWHIIDKRVSFTGCYIIQNCSAVLLIPFQLCNVFHGPPASFFVMQYTDAKGFLFGPASPFRCTQCFALLALFFCRNRAPARHIPSLPQPLMFTKSSRFHSQPGSVMFFWDWAGNFIRTDFYRESPYGQSDHGDDFFQI